jgi:hypothetical protein
MDKEQARFVLRSFRPDGVDAADPEFSAALGMAARDRELGEWLAYERAQDSAFSKALVGLPIPETLRDDILHGFAIARGDVALDRDELDLQVGRSLASIEPPAGLRDEILAAMLAERSHIPARTKPGKRWFRIGAPVAAAAGIALAFLSGSNARRMAPPPPSTAVVQADHRVTVEAVRAGFMGVCENSPLALERANRDPHDMFVHLKAKKLPCSGCASVPRGLQNTPGLGCREFVIQGKRGSLMCFNNGGNTVVHFLIFRRDDILDAIPAGKPPSLLHVGKWSVATWADEEEVYLLISETDEKTLAGLF